MVKEGVKRSPLSTTVQAERNLGPRHIKAGRGTEGHWGASTRVPFLTPTSNGPNRDNYRSSGDNGEKM